MRKFELDSIDEKLVVKDSDGRIYKGEAIEILLNDFEKTRLRKNKEINKFKDREDRYQRVIGGIKAYLELELNNELWWEWNE